MGWAALLLFLVVPLLSEQFIVSYRVVMRDQMILNERFTLSRSMLREPMREGVFACTVLPDEGDDEKMEVLLKTLYQDELIACLSGFGVKLRAEGVAERFQSHSTSVLSIPPTRIEAVDNGTAIEIHYDPQRAL